MNTMYNEKVAVIVVTYNRLNILKECIAALEKQTIRDLLDIIIIDNCSTDGTKEALADMVRCGRIIYINTGSNLGGAGGFNYGIRYAADKFYKYVWVMDDDCIPNHDALEALLNKANQSDIGKFGFLSSRVLWKDGEDCVMNRQRSNAFQPIKDLGKCQHIAMASFVSLLLPVDVIYKYGLPIRDFVIWTDDWEYTRRISRYLPCWYVPESVVVHKSASNMGANIATDISPRLARYRFMYRNDVYLYRREGFQGFIYEVFRLGLHFLRVLCIAKNEKIKRLKLIVLGTLEGIGFHPEIEFIERDNNENKCA